MDKYSQESPEDEFTHPSNISSKPGKRGTKGNRSEQQRRYRAKKGSAYRDYMRRYMAFRRGSTLLTNE